MAGPAIFLIGLFVILPFVFALGLSFTDQRLVSPNPTQWVGGANYRQLLSVNLLVLQPESDADGKIAVDEMGAAKYPSVRSYTRNNPAYPQYDGMHELTNWRWGDARVYLLARDVVFIKAIINTFIFVLVVAPVQGGLALGLALLINQKLPGLSICSAPSTSCRWWFRSSLSPCYGASSTTAIRVF